MGPSMLDFDESTVDKESDGVWQEYEGSEFRIAHMGNMGFQREFARLQRPYKRDIAKDRLDPSTAQKIMCQAMAKHVLLDWRNVKGKDGEVAYSTEKAYSLLNRNSSFRRFVVDFATELDNFRAEELEEVGKSPASISK